MNRQLIAVFVMLGGLGINHSVSGALDAPPAGWQPGEVIDLPSPQFLWVPTPRTGFEEVDLIGQELQQEVEHWPKVVYRSVEALFDAHGREWFGDWDTYDQASYRTARTMAFVHIDHVNTVIDRYNLAISKLCLQPPIGLSQFQVIPDPLKRLPYPDWPDIPEHPQPRRSAC